MLRVRSDHRPLRELSEVACLRSASVYQRFESLAMFHGGTNQREGGKRE
jgi:transcriptional regulator NrdR family protein